MTKANSKLFFLVSQPRSGSTLLQHIIASHSDVGTLPEPWFMLHLAYGLRANGLTAEYNSYFAYLAFKEFLARVPGGEVLFYAGIKNTAEMLYGEAAKTTRKTVFLDKTPRYYHIIGELHKILPEAKVVLLTRNPLAVFTSILNYNFRGNWFEMLCSEDRRHDLITAPRLITDAILAARPNAVQVRYEDVVKSPKETVEKLCHALDVPFEDAMLNYGGKVAFPDTSFVDTKSVYQHDTPVGDYVDAWKRHLDSPVKVAIAGAYLDALSDEVLSCYGFSRSELEGQLQTLPGFVSEQSNQWARFLQTGSEEDLPPAEKWRRRIAWGGAGTRRLVGGVMRRIRGIMRKIGLARRLES